MLVVKGEDARGCPWWLAKYVLAYRISLPKCRTERRTIMDVMLMIMRYLFLWVVIDNLSTISDNRKANETDNTAMMMGMEVSFPF